MLLRSKGLVIACDGARLRIDGVKKGAVLIDCRRSSRGTPIGYRVRVTEREGGEFVVSHTATLTSPLGRLLSRLFWAVNGPRLNAIYAASPRLS